MCGVASAAAQVTIGLEDGQVVTSPDPLDPVVDKILTRLEDRKVDDLTARLIWDIESPIEDDVIRKFGQVWFKEMDPVAKFRAKLDRKMVLEGGDKQGTSRPIGEEHLFDGRWYYLIQHDNKSVSKELIREAGDPTDVYALGRGAFPLPFGQKKAEIQREFTVERIADSPTDPENADHLKLTPRPGMQMAAYYKSMHFWVQREGAYAGLPRKVRVEKIGGTGKVKNIITMTFNDIKLDSGLGSSVFNFEVPSGYQVEEGMADSDS
jgi:hypothetical protein